MADSTTQTPAATLPESSDRMLAAALGRNLQGATLRLMLYLVILGAVLATVAALAH
jgi:hypothetical protein